MADPGPLVGEVLVPGYELTCEELPDCWALHFPVVIELSWLRSAHVQSYLRHTHPHITAEWHTRWRTAVLARIKELIPERNCRPGEHLTPKESSQTVGRGRAPEGAAAWGGGRAPRFQPATPEHWWPFYQRAFHADLDRRRNRRETSDADYWVPAARSAPE